jgi:hypothetical protein
MASVLDSVAPPSAQLAGESIRVHDDFFGDANVELLNFCPDLTNLASRCSCLQHTYLRTVRDKVLSIPASSILRSGQTIVSLRESKKHTEPHNLRIGGAERLPSSFDRTICPGISAVNDSASIFVFAKVHRRNH